MKLLRSLHNFANPNDHEHRVCRFTESVLVTPRSRFWLDRIGNPIGLGVENAEHCELMIDRLNLPESTPQDEALQAGFAGGFVRCNVAPGWENNSQRSLTLWCCAEQLTQAQRKWLKTFSEDHNAEVLMALSRGWSETPEQFTPYRTLFETSR